MLWNVLSGTTYKCGAFTEVPLNQVDAPQASAASEKIVPQIFDTLCIINNLASYLASILNTKWIDLYFAKKLLKSWKRFQTIGNQFTLWSSREHLLYPKVLFWSGSI